MKAIHILFDSLNRHMLQPYGSDWVKTPNFQRLADRTVRFTNSYVGSMPCMPARRDLHAGRYSFLHRSWGPLEPFDESMPDILKNNGIHTHLASDHYHYWEAGGANYHTKYTTWEFCRGQEGDPWVGQVADPFIPEHLGHFDGHHAQLYRQDWINREHMREEAQHSQARTFQNAIEFLDLNHNQDRWLLQIEAFDPHEPFFSHDIYKALYPHRYDGPHFDWIYPGGVRETKEEAAHLRFEYAALVSMCDAYLGKVLDKMDEYGLWDDTLLIVNTDHGYLLGEHDYWGKNVMPLYNEIAKTPFFIWNPQIGRPKECCDALVQMIDLAPTLLEWFGMDIPGTMLGQSISGLLKGDVTPKEAVLFGYHGSYVNVTDGRYVYMRAAATYDNRPLYEYTLMPAHMASSFSPSELTNAKLAQPFSFTKGCPTLKIDAGGPVESLSFGTLLFDLEQDPGQLHPIQDNGIEQGMIGQMKRLMKQCDAPQEQYERLGLTESNR